MAMRDLATWIRKRVTPAVLVSFLLGVVLGLVVLGWWLWPVEWTNTDPSDLNPTAKEAYLQMIADSYAAGGDDRLVLAQERLAALQKPGQPSSELSEMLLHMIEQKVSAGRAQEALNLQRLIRELDLPAPTAPETSQPAASTGGSLLRVLAILFFLGLLGAGLALLLGQLQKREGARRRRSPTQVESLEHLPPEPEEQLPSPPVEGHEPKLAEFETSYAIGEDGYDVSFHIDSAAGEFLGECGVSALERVDVGQPDRFTAFDLWLFDKLDSWTETRVLLSERAFADVALRERISGRGEPILAQPDQVVALETANLKLLATITDLAYEDDSDSGVFSRLSTRLQIVAKLQNAS